MTARLDTRSLYVWYNHPMKELSSKLHNGEKTFDNVIRISSKSELVSRDFIHAVSQDSSSLSIKTAELTDNLDKDLKASGVSLFSEEKKLWKEKTAKLGNEEQQKSVASKDDQDIFAVSLPEYQKTFIELSKTYGIDKQKLKFGLLEGLLIQGKTIQALAGMGFNTIAFTLWADQKNLPKTTEAVGRFVARKTIPNVMEDKGAPMGAVPLQLNDKHLMDAAQELAGEAKRFKWPLAIMLSFVPSVIAEYAGRTRLLDAMKTVRRSINDRAANSLFMRDMEFVHDKSAAEINNIIEKGKKSTVDLFYTTYSDVIPRLATIGLATVGQIPMNPIGAVLQLTRLPFLYAGSKSYAQDVLKERAADLKRKDQIDTRINATLGSLEIVKTSDSMEQAIGQLKDNMTTRDESQTSTSKKQVKEGIKKDIYNMAFDIGIPLVSSGIDFIRSGNKVGRAAQTGLMGIMGSGVVKQNAQEVVDIYIDKIQPALQDIKRMEDLLGPYEKLDKPDGQLEQQRIGVSSIKSFDISVHDLSYKNILHHVSLDVPQGAFVTLKGSSGSGKTTLMRHMLGLFSPGQEVVTYGNTDLQKIKKFGSESIYSAIGYANQNPQFFENMTLRENLLLWTKKSVTEEQITHVLRDLRLDHIVDRLDSTVKHFSGGELRRIGIARALLKDPKVLFLDEPTANLDEESAKQVLEIVRTMRKTRPEMTVFAVTHDPNFESIAERIVHMRDINKPTEHESTLLGNRQAFYASASGIKQD